MKKVVMIFLFILLIAVIITGIILIKKDNSSEALICVDQCGENICAEIVCLAEGCPCAETIESCPEDCEVGEGLICCESYGWGAYMIKCCEEYELMAEEDCVTPEPPWTGGGKQVVDNSYCT